VYVLLCGVLVELAPVLHPSKHDGVIRLYCSFVTTFARSGTRPFSLNVPSSFCIIRAALGPSDCGDS
jgi:hypothetical protein